jgi:hypothetical protein
LSQAQPPQFEVRRDVRSKHLSQERPQKDSRSQSKHRSQEKENETETKEENMPPDKEHSTSKPTKRNSQEKNSSSSTSKTTSTSPRAGDRKKETPSVEPKVTHDKHLKITLSPATRPRKYSAPPKSNEKLHKDIKSNEPKENSPLVSTSTSTSTTTPTPSTTTTTTTSSVTTSGTTHTNSPSIPTRERIDKDNKEKELHHHKDYKKKVIETSSVKRNSLDITRTSKDQTVTSSSGQNQIQNLFLFRSFIHSFIHSFFLSFSLSLSLSLSLLNCYVSDNDVYQVEERTKTTKTTGEKHSVIMEKKCQPFSKLLLLSLSHSLHPIQRAKFFLLLRKESD